VGNLVQDLRFAVRTLRKSPGFLIIALLTLAVGIGATTTIFSVVDAVLLRPLPFPESDRLVAVYQTLPSKGVFNNGVSYLNYLDLTRQTRSFEQLAAIRMHDFTLTGQGEPVLVAAGSVTSNLFSMLRMNPLRGRALTVHDDDLGAPPVAVIGERLWRSRYGGDPAIVGKFITLDNTPFTVVGIAPAQFKTPPENPPAELWVSLTHDPVFGDLAPRRGGHYLKLVGRLKNGVQIEQAQTELVTIEDALDKQFPAENEGWSVRLVPLVESLVSDVRTALSVLLGAVGLVFLIACANVANLLLVRTSARSREIAIRSALGARRSRLVQQILTECLFLGLAGGALGLALAVAAIRGIRAWVSSDLPRVGEIQIDVRMLLFAALFSLLAAIAFGLGPALHTSNANLSETLKEGALSAGETAGKKRVRSLLVIFETTLSFILLIGAGLLGRSFLHLQDVNLGFNPYHVLTAGISLPRAEYAKSEQWLSFYTRLIAQLKNQPGVVAVTATLPLPLEGGGLNFAFQIAGRPPEKGGFDLTSNYTSLSKDYFQVLDIPLIAGRSFDERDTATSPKVCLVSSTFAHRFFPGENPFDKVLIFGFTKGEARKIVGIVRDVKRDGPASPSRPEMYVPFEQDPWWAAYIAIRTVGPPLSLSSAIREQVAALDPRLPISEIQPMTEIAYESVAQPRFRTMLLVLFGSTALLLAVIGIYGVISYSVGLRRREIAIRLALGAEKADVLLLILRQGLGTTAVGLVAGLLGAFALTRYLSQLLFEVTPIDPLTYLAVALLLLGAGLLASWIPARRALIADPVRMLRHE